MEKYPFTATGVAQLQLALYALNNEQLHEEADDLDINFVDWMDGHFILSEEQYGFMADSDADIISYISGQCSLALRNRLPILLDKPADVGARASKIIRPENKLATAWLSDGNYNISGELIIHITYG